MHILYTCIFPEAVILRANQYHHAQAIDFLQGAVDAMVIDVLCNRHQTSVVFKHQALVTLDHSSQMRLDSTQSGLPL